MSYGSDSDMSGMYSASYDCSDDENENSDSKSEHDDAKVVEVVPDHISVQSDENSNQLAKDKAWLDSFIQEKLKKQITKVEQEVDNIRNKKIRGATKKQKDMLKTLNDKLKLMRATREKCEELAMTMEFLEGKAIKNL